MESRRNFNSSKLLWLVYVTCKNEEDPFKNEGTRVVTIRDFMVVLVTCKNKEEQIKNEGARVVTRFSPL